MFNYSTKCRKSPARLPKRALESAYEYCKDGNRTAALTVIKILSEQTKKAEEKGIKRFYEKAINVIQNQNQFVTPEEQYNVIMIFGDLFPDLKEETPAILSLEFKYDPRPAYDSASS